ncbi:MAG: NAD(P)H-dependent oxidoreductase subunit E [Verrucomicrobiales bacterium]|nr:NAD(P)H-dependent oxidoreductase subunit E [Verrucomicrobiales bacterium]
MEVNEELDQKADEAISHYPPEEKRSAALPLLHLVQKQFGFISDDAVSWVAQKLELEPIKILELVTFYPGLRQKAPGKYHIRVCRTLSCAMAGCHQTMEKICEIAGIDRTNVSHHDPIAVSGDGKFSIEFAECLASCGTGPVCLVGDDFHEEVKPKDAKAMLAKYK